MRRAGSITLLFSSMALFAFVSCSDPAPERLVAIEPPHDTPLHEFSIAADMRGYTGSFEFEGALQALVALGPGAFLLSPGDIDPPQAVFSSIEGVLGSGFLWVPVVGNHEAETPEDMTFLRVAFSALTGELSGYRAGPPVSNASCYSFAIGACRIIVLNQYFDGSSDIGEAPEAPEAGTVGDALYSWLADELDAALEPYVIVVGHEPAYPQPDSFTGRLRHAGDSLDAHPTERDRFQAVLEAKGADLYLFGHTHNQSTIRVGSVLHADAGHARGIADEGAPSTFLKFAQYSDRAELLVYRSQNGLDYLLVERSAIWP